MNEKDLHIKFEEINEHHEKVQSEIDEIISFQQDNNLKRIELKSVLSGYVRYLKDRKIGGRGISYFLNKLKIVDIGASEVKSEVIN